MIVFDLVGALADQQERGVPHESLDLVLLGIAVAAVNPEAGLGDLGAELASQVLGHARLQIVALPGVLETGRIDHHQVCGLHFGGHFGKRERDALVLGDRLTEGGPLLGVAHREFERPDRDAAAPAQRH